MGTKKQITLVMALCKLHNFCLEADDEMTAPIALLPADELTIINDEGIELNRVGTLGSNYTTKELLHGGKHF